MKVVVTGGKGFIGSALLKRLPGAVSVDLPECDLKDFDQASAALAGVDEVFHLAADKGGIDYMLHTKSQIYVNARIDLNVADVCRLNEVEHVFYASSACAAEWISGYGWAKRFGEELFKGVKARIARFFNVYGPGDLKGPVHSGSMEALCTRVLQAQDGDTITVWGDGSQQRSFLYIDDCVDAILALMRSEYMFPVEICTCDYVSIDDLVRLIVELSGKQLYIKHDTSKPVGVRTRVCHPQLMRGLNWRPRVSLREGVRRYLAWLRSLPSFSVVEL